MRSFIVALIVGSFVSWQLCAGDLSNNAVKLLDQALSHLPNDSSVLELPEGTYLIASTWTISRDDITIRGAGIGKTVLVRGPGFSGALVSMTGEGGVISALTIDGDAHN